MVDVGSHRGRAPFCAGIVRRRAAAVKPDLAARLELLFGWRLGPGSRVVLGQMQPAEIATVVVFATVSDRHLREALRLAAKGRYRTAPNPRVGALVTNSKGVVVGRGFHRALGQDHAEVVALREAGARARSGTLYVTLEPCSHQGRTPPCTRAVFESGVRRVVACHVDPNPRVAGAGFQALAAAGVKVEWGALMDEAIAMNLGFVVSHLLARPQVTLKWAMSLDGRIATTGGESQWISSPSGRQWALALREEHDAIVVGSGTALADDPSLNRRLGYARSSNTRVILDRRLRLSPSARLFAAEGPVVVYTESSNAERKKELQRAGARVVRRKRLSLAKMLGDLHRRGVQSLLVEGGGTILGAFMAEGMFDRVEVLCAPMLIGGDGAPGPVGGAGIDALASSPRLEAFKVGRRGPDVILSTMRKGRLEELGAMLKTAASRREKRSDRV